MEISAGPLSMPGFWIGCMWSCSLLTYSRIVACMLCVNMVEMVVLGTHYRIISPLPLWSKLQLAAGSTDFNWADYPVV